MGLTDSFYRVCVLRYVSAVACGTVLCLYEKELKKSMLPLFALIAGVLYEYLVVYTGYTPVLATRWTNTSIFAAPYAFGIVWLFLKMEDRMVEARRMKRVIAFGAYLGKASYHIFLMQMVYFGTALSREILEMTNLGISIIVDLAICLAAGCVFYELEQRIRKALRVKEKRLTAHNIMKQ